MPLPQPWKPFLLTTGAGLGHLAGHHAEKDLQESQRGSGQDAPAFRCVLEQQLGRLGVGRLRPKWNNS